MLGVFWKMARIGERLSPYTSMACVLMAVSSWLPFHPLLVHFLSNARSKSVKDRKLIMIVRDGSHSVPLDEMDYSRWSTNWTNRGIESPADVYMRVKGSGEGQLVLGVGECTMISFLYQWNRWISAWLSQGNPFHPLSCLPLLFSFYKYLWSFSQTQLWR